MVTPEVNSGVSVRQQCELLELNRSSLYYTPVELSEEDRRLMNAIDVEFTKCPFYGARKIARELRLKGWSVGRKRVRTLMRLLGLEAVVPTKNTSKRNPQHKIHPYLLRGVKIDHVNQAWGMDITYIRLGKGFAYLVAVMDWHSRYVISWRLSNTLTTDFCVECLQDALQYGAPEIVNTDQGCQFTSEAFTRVLLEKGIKISMDGRGRALDNIFVERLWRSVKYENVYLKGYQAMPEAREGLREYFDFYNMERSHQSLGYQTPWGMYAGLTIVEPGGIVAQKI